jgi:hypothetical protein
MSNPAGNGPRDKPHPPARHSKPQYLKYSKYLKYPSNADPSCGRYAPVTNGQKTPSPRALRSHQVKVSLSDSEYFALLAEADDEAAALIVRKAVKQYLSDQKRKKGKQ